jgi:hypothetical protein
MARKPDCKAEQFLEILEGRFPDGIPTIEAALLIYNDDSRQARERVAGLAKTLRGWNFSVYSAHGVYYLCDNNPEKFVAVGCYREGLSLGGTAAYVEMLLAAERSRPAGEQARILANLKTSAARTFRHLARRLEKGA